MTITERFRQARKGVAIAAGAALELILLLGVDAPTWALAAVPVLTAIAGYAIPNDATERQRMQLVCPYLDRIGELLAAARRPTIIGDVSRETSDEPLAAGDYPRGWAAPTRGQMIVPSGVPPTPSRPDPGRRDDERRRRGRHGAG